MLRIKLKYRCMVVEQRTIRRSAPTTDYTIFSMSPYIQLSTDRQLSQPLNIETRQKYPTQVVTWWQWGGPFEEMRLLTKPFLSMKHLLRVQTSPRNHSLMSTSLICRSFIDRNH